MPDSGFWGGNLTTAVSNGSVSEARVTDMVRRQLAAYYYIGQDTTTYPPPSVYASTQKHLPVNVQGTHSTLIRQIGAAGTVLVKNTNSALPFTTNTTFLAVYGYDAVVKPSPWSNPSRFGGGYEVNFGWNTLNGTLITGGGSGSSTPSWVIDPFHAITERIRSVRGTLRWDFYSIAPTPQYINAEACLVFINAYASESFDRTSLTDSFSDTLVSNVAKNCTNTIVVIHSTGIRVVDAWIDNPNITAVIFAGLPGQESGNALADILWGDANPSGRLPYTVARKESDYGALLNSSTSFDPYPQDTFTEGLYIDYRAFDRDDIEPRYEFGYGLSYTTFSYSDLIIGDFDGMPDEYPNPSTPILQGGHPELWHVLLNVTVSVTNTGDVPGYEVAQLYLGIPDAPARQLRGFEKVFLQPGEMNNVVFGLTRRDMSVWDVVAQQWRVQTGEYGIWVGASSRDLRVNGTMSVG
jgi:beta-glucosidase